MERFKNSRNPKFCKSTVLENTSVWHGWKLGKKFTKQNSLNLYSIGREGADHRQFLRHFNSIITWLMEEFENGREAPSPNKKIKMAASKHHNIHMKKNRAKEKYLQRCWSPPIVFLLLIEYMIKWIHNEPFTKVGSVWRLESLTHVDLPSTRSEKVKNKMLIM